jgi:shikimate kinase
VAIKENMERLYIAGLPCCGKSHLLNQLSRIFSLRSYDFIDLDELILAESGFKSIAEFVGIEGWDAFRKLELKILSRVKSQEKTFIALGGGSLNQQSLQLFHGEKICWIKMEPQDSWNKFKNDETRPLREMGEQKVVEILKNRYDLVKDIVTEIQLPIKIDEFAKVFGFSVDKDEENTMLELPKA